MRELAGKTAFVTGGASGIGFALGRAFADAGMKVMLADIEPDALAAAVRSLHDSAPDVRGIPCDVADPASVERAANASYEAFGNVHVVCNNAGVGGGSGIDNISLDTWRWVLDVNLMGVLHGIRIFLPHIRAHGEGGHIVNTASITGMNSGLGFSPYSASKFAVVNMSEGLAMQVAPLGIGVTVLCPGFVRTRIWESGRNRPERYGPMRTPDLASTAGKLIARLDRTRPGRTRPIRCCRAGSCRDPERRTLCVHAFRCGLAGRATRAIRRHLGGNGPSGGSLMRSTVVRSASQDAPRLFPPRLRPPPSPRAGGGAE
ncbi:SDR family NAD(P)-dependent oxidoreductase [Rhodopila sp.]|uniref:SDR family NAD(P)-dependent oxidoreductase n=1 Tax=Rhodopila sp. TaxID=2480087 RepID=UPI003D0B8FC0